MAIQLKPELEALIQEDVAQGPYRTPDEFLERAVHMLHDQERWLRENRDDIATKIEQGFVSAECGHLRTSAQAQERMAERKRAWSQSRS